MVHCVRCGAENPDDAEFCNKCGSRLDSTGEREAYKRRARAFGLPRGGAIFAIFIGILIILAGIGQFLPEEMYGINLEKLWWAIVGLGFGILIIAGAIYGFKRQSRQ